MKVLIVYSGGTIGMQSTENGLTASGGFAERLRAQQQKTGEALVQWRWRELDKPIDSANIQPAHWLKLRDLIVDGLIEEHCNAALLLHGTDSMAYSAAALSFLLMDLPQPVLLSGSMLPADAPKTDAWDNLLGALRILQAGVPSGVWLYFQQQLLKGARVYKQSSTHLQAFAERPCLFNAALSPIPPALNYQTPRKPLPIAIQPLYPGLSPATLRAVLSSGIKALIIECYGSGTAPEDADLLAELAQASQQGVLLLAISQCPHGQVDLTQYAASQSLQQAGVISGSNLGREAALGKLFALLGAGLSLEETKYWINKNLCGELA
ncbi:L-asparaginase 1 [Ventosimonas gracilis]|uniref:asparaginase n=1 Tax=Ventosimonas gracilis TaxID=1680762 RepID=A0A139SIB6_9GAMM|nr:asparaginase [Ventosimonas gracilis]KXU34273.1 L-asparaginase 1 [Ventosimonas gracilis]